MMELVVIADDFTGALDTGIKFAQTGAHTRMFIGPDIDFGYLTDDVEVVIVDSETRHLAPADSHDIIYNLVRRFMDHGANRFYKKTDSGLRGCVGAELSALAEAAGKPVRFVPALPSENRYTEGGVHYINGTPVSQSIFGQDPFEPVRHDRVSEILAEQTDCALANLPADADKDADIYIYDAHTTEDLEQIAADLAASDALSVAAGCAGFAQVVQKMLPLAGDGTPDDEKTEGAFIVCGTVHEVTLGQMAYASEHGFKRITLDEKEKLEPEYLTTEEGRHFLEKLERYCRGPAPVIVDVDPKGQVILEDNPYVRAHGWSEAELRERIAERLGAIAECWTHFDLDHTLILSGGDTAYGFLSRIGVKEVIPVREVCQGAVLFKIKAGKRTLQIVSKSGGFGSEDFFTTIVPMLTTR